MSIQPKVIALGFFDGVHLGHGALLRRTVEEAKHRGVRSAVFTWAQPPKEVVTDVPVPLINSPEDRAWLAEHLAEQITALHREIAAWPLRAWDSASPGLGKWQRKRLENQEFERRLFEMKRERELRLNNSETLEEQQLLMREISALEGRIARCRQALDEIERIIERLTR